MEPAPVSTAIGEAVYWLVWLLFLPVILAVLGLVATACPSKPMLSRLLAFLPNLLAAVVIVVVGLFVARILQRIVASALHAFGADALSERLGLANLGKPNLSGLIGLVVYILVFIPVVIAALNATGLTYLAEPLSDMLQQVLLAFPKIFVAMVVLGLTYMVARVIPDLVALCWRTPASTRWLPGSAWARFPDAPDEPLQDRRLRGPGGHHAVRDPGGGGPPWLDGDGDHAGGVYRLPGGALLALIILVVGIYLANLAGKVFLSTGLEQKRVLALLAGNAIIVFAVAMALDQVGLANESSTWRSA